MESKWSVMIVEDDPRLIEAATVKMDIAGLKVIPFVDGNKALNYLVNTDELPDAIWLDYYLKDMNGLIFMTELTKIYGLEDIPVFVISNSQNDANVKEFKGLGAVNYIVKTQKRLEDIISTIVNYLEENNDKDLSN